MTTGDVDHHLQEVPHILVAALVRGLRQNLDVLHHQYILIEPALQVPGLHLQAIAVVDQIMILDPDHLSPDLDLPYDVTDHLFLDLDPRRDVKDLPLISLCVTHLLSDHSWTVLGSQLDQAKLVMVQQLLFSRQLDPRIVVVLSILDLPPVDQRHKCHHLQDPQQLHKCLSLHIIDQLVQPLCSQPQLGREVAPVVLEVHHEVHQQHIPLVRLPEVPASTTIVTAHHQVLGVLSVETILTVMIVLQALRRLSDIRVTVQVQHIHDLNDSIRPVSI